MPTDRATAMWESIEQVAKLCYHVGWLVGIAGFYDTGMNCYLYPLSSAFDCRSVSKKTVPKVG
jgi:hypothetical protein